MRETVVNRKRSGFMKKPFGYIMYVVNETGVGTIEISYRVTNNLYSVFPDPSIESGSGYAEFFCCFSNIPAMFLYYHFNMPFLDFI